MGTCWGICRENPGNRQRVSPDDLLRMVPEASQCPRPEMPSLLSFWGECFKVR